MKASDLIGVGKIVKIHGIHGELIIETVDLDVFENIEGPVFIVIDGLPVPFFIDRHTPVSSTRTRATIKWITSETKAKSLVNHAVYVMPNQVKIGESNITQSPDILNGFLVIDAHHGELGTITRVLYQNNNPVLAINHPKNEILIPLHPDLVSGLDTQNKLLHIIAPKGLIGLYI
jgi:16S rRNA processing protein RimM